MARRNDGTGCGVLLIAVFALALIGRCTSSPTDPAQAVAQTPEVSTSTKYVATASLNCRSEPDQTGARVTSFPRREPVQVSATEGSWSKVERAIGGPCWVSSKYLSDELRTAPAAPARALLSTSSDFSPEPPRRKRRSSGSGYSCGGKRYCREMNSCAEAYHYLNQCGVYRLDGDGDGVPCESIC